MLGKILVTLAVIAIAVVVVRQRKEGESGKARPAARAVPAEESSMGKDLRFAAYLFLVLMFGTGGVVYYYRWQDDHTVLSVNLYRDGQSEPVSYRVYKSELDTRSFTTIDGIRITVADSERMEVTGLEQP